MAKLTVIFLGAVITMHLATSATGQADPVSAPPEERSAIDYSKLYAAAGVSDCVKNCSFDLAEVSGKSFDFDGSVSVEEVCSTYRNASACVNKQGCEGKKFFEIATKGMKMTCVDNFALLKFVKPCLDAHSNRILKACDDESGFTAALNKALQSEEVQKLADEGGDLVTLLQHLGSACSEFLSFLACAHKGLNQNCPGVGTAFVDTSIAPLEYAAKDVQGAPGGISAMVEKRFPPECKVFLDVDGINRLKLFGIIPEQKKKKPA